MPTTENLLREALRGIAERVEGLFGREPAQGWSREYLHEVLTEVAERAREALGPAAND